MAGKTSRKSAKAAKKAAAKKTAVKKVAAKAAKPRKAKPSSGNGAGPVLLSGGNPQIAKGYGDAPVQAYIAAMPGWKRELGRRLDALIARTVPGVHKAVKWNSPFYGIEGEGWFLSYHCFAKYVKVTFFRGTSLRPVPAGESKHPGRALPRHPRGRPARRSAVRRLGEAGQPIARRTHVSGARGAMTDLLRFNGAVRRDPRIEAWFSDFADPLRLTVRTWFERMRGCGADVRELLHDGCPVGCVGGRAVRLCQRVQGACQCRLLPRRHARRSRRPARRRRASACVM